MKMEAGSWMIEVLADDELMNFFDRNFFLTKAKM
ncbi:hypothetical protein C8D70_105151 [Chryseobacterium sp. CBTAP 102]|nr:hypothetical protein C8D70_105151 [Chryseobacterium sp. CBTAP 102]